MNISPTRVTSRRPHLQHQQAGSSSLDISRTIARAIYTTVSCSRVKFDRLGHGCLSQTDTGVSSWDLVPTLLLLAVRQRNALPHLFSCPGVNTVCRTCQFLLVLHYLGSSTVVISQCCLQKKGFVLSSSQINYIFCICIRRKSDTASEVLKFPDGAFLEVIS